MPAHPARSSDTYPPGDRIVPASVRHTVRRMQVAAVAVASVAVHRIAVVQEWDSGAVAVTATLSAAADSAAVRSSVSAFAAEVDMAVSAAVVALEQGQVAAVAAVGLAESGLPSCRTECRCSSLFSVLPPFRQSSSGLAAWHKGVPARER